MTGVALVRLGPYPRWIDDGDPTGDGFWVKQYAVEAIGTDGRVHSAYAIGGETATDGAIDVMWRGVERMLEEQMREDGVWP